MQLRLLGGSVGGSLARWLAGLGLALGLEACVVHDTPPVNPGYGETYGYGGVRSSSSGGMAASVSVGEPSPYTVSGMPPEPLYEQMSDSPGDGSVWIDGYWHWNGYEWVWVNGRWEREQQGYVYVEPNYDYQGEQYVYTPGYWSEPTRVPRGWNLRDHRDGRPRRVAPPVRNGNYHPPVRGTRTPRPGALRPPVANPGGGGGGYRPPGRPSRRPYYDPNGGGTWRPQPPGPVIGRRNPVNPAPGGGAVVTPGAGEPAGGPISAPGGGGVWRPAPTPRPSAPPPTGGPIYVNPAGPSGGIARPPPAMGRPIYVNPAGPAQGGSYRPPPPAQPGGPIYVNPAGPSAPPASNNSGGGNYRPAPGQNSGGAREPAPGAAPPRNDGPHRTPSRGPVRRSN